MKAVISDLHGNLEALEAVLTNIKELGVESVYCLGDIAGYGSGPGKCIDLLMGCPVVLLGNHDQEALQAPEGSYVRTQIERPEDAAEDRRRRRAFLQERPLQHEEGEILFVHGSAWNPLSEYVFPEDVNNKLKMERIFARVGKVCIQGHTHMPGIFTEDLTFLVPESFGSVWRLDARKILCNVGSVGLPRDGDPRASYVILDDEAIRFRRVSYS